MADRILKRTLHPDPTPAEYGLGQGQSGNRKKQDSQAQNRQKQEHGSQAGAPDAQIVPMQSEYERLLCEIRELRAQIVRLTALRDDLVWRICPSLRAIYEEEIGSIEREILAAEIYLREKQRILEILTAQMNRREQMSFDKARKQAGEERQGFEEDLKRRTKAADDFRDRWKNGTGWSSHRYEGSGDGEGPEEPGEGSGGSGAAGEQGRKEGGEAGRNDGSAGGHAGPGSNQEEEKLSFLQRIKQLYRKIVKRLHPDVRQNQTEHEKDLFRRARGAYEKGDLDTLERIWEELEGMGDSEESFEDTPENVEKMRAVRKTLNALLNNLREEIAAIRAEFPYTMKDLLESEELLAARKEELNRRLHDVREANAALEETISKLRAEMNL